MESRKTLKPACSLCLILTCLLILAGSAEAGNFLMATDGVSSNNNSKASSLGHTVTTDTLANIVAMMPTALAAYDVVWVSPPNQSAVTYTALKSGVAPGASLEQYVNNGGILVLCLAGNIGNQTDIAPGGVDATLNAFNGIFHEEETFTTPAHPYLTGADYSGAVLAESDFDNWGSTDHGQLTSLPGGATTVLSNTDGPSWVQYPWGCGQVIVNTLTYGWTNSGIALDNLINYADFLEITPGCDVCEAGFSGAYELQNWSSSGILEGTTSISPSSGRAGSATFGYHVDRRPSGSVSFRTATFSATAATTRTLTFDYAYSGFHAFCCQPDALLQVFANGPGGTETITLVNDLNAGTSFSHSGSASITIHQGYDFGFIAGGRNGDSDSRLIGNVTISNVNGDADSDSFADGCDDCPGVNPVLVGDINCDGAVNLLDFVLLSGNFLAEL